MSYGDGSALSPAGRVIVDTLIGFVRIVGLWALIYGAILIKRANTGAYDPKTQSAGVMHLVGGVAGINIVATLHMVAETFGLETLLAYVIA